MDSIRNILILYHRNIGDEAALERALSLARSVGGSVIVSEILDLNDTRPLSWFLPPSHGSQRAWKRLLTEREAHFDRLLASTQRLNVPVRFRVLTEGPPYESVIRAVAEEKIDLVIVTGADIELAGAGARRSLVAKLVRNCPCPVWVVDPLASNGLRRLVAAISLPEDPAEDRLATARILKLVDELRLVEQCRVDILHAWDFIGAERDRVRCGISRDELRRMEHAAAEGRRARISALLPPSTNGQEPIEIHVERGEPNVVIPAFATRHHVDLVVMGCKSGARLKSLFTPNMAKDVFDDIPCSVLAVGRGADALPAVEHPLS